MQIIKGSFDHKGPKLTSEISIYGKFLILMPFSKKILFSKKIFNVRELYRLINLIKKINNKGFGIRIIKLAKKINVQTLKLDVLFLVNKYKNLLKNLPNKNPPIKVMSELEKFTSIIKYLLNFDLKSIYCDDKCICEYIRYIAPEKNLNIYNNNFISIFEKFCLERQIQILLGKNVPIYNGAYLVIEHTEALHVIDVNSGISENKNEQQNVALAVNILACSEIARQLRIRDMGGIIIVDFIDLSDSEKRKQLFKHLKYEMQYDKAKYKIIPPTKFGLIQITRQRVQQELNIFNKETNPNKKNKIEAPLVHLLRLENTIFNFIKYHSIIYLHTHPFIAAYLKYGSPSTRMKWFFRYKKWIKIIPRDSFKYLEYQIIDYKNKILFVDKN